MPKTSAKRILVVGGGVAGLAAANELLSLGYAVALVEKASAAGGKIRQGPGGIDAGPTVMTMAWVFNDIFTRAGVKFEDRLILSKSDVIARHFFPQSPSLDLYCGREKSYAAIEKFAGTDEAEGYLRFRNYVQDIYDATFPNVVLTKSPSLLGVLGSGGLSNFRAALKIDPFRNLYSAVSRFFKDPRLRQLFARYATYTGSNPFLAPATLNVIAHVEFSGLWIPQPSMHALANALQQLFEERGGELILNTDIQRIDINEKKVQVHSPTQSFNGDALVFGGVPHALPKLLGKPAARRLKPPKHKSLSALTLCTTSPSVDRPWLHHNLFFSKNYRKEFDDLQKQKRVPHDPTLYLCAQSRRGEHSADIQDEKCLWLINAPADGSAQNPHYDEQKFKERFNAIFAEHDIPIRVGPQDSLTTPDQFDAAFPYSQGALYGAATHGPFATFSRPQVQSGYARVFLCGGGVHPGAGVPMAALSGTFAAQSVQAYFNSQGQEV